MSFKSSSTSEFADAYKLKPSLDKKSMRLRRKSMDWKKSRQEETNKRRGIQQFSPLQEISGNSILNEEYKDKTPLKAERKGTAEKKVAADTKNLREQLLQWKKERVLKKKLEYENKKKPLFKVGHIERKETVLYQQSAKNKSAPNKIEKPAVKNIGNQKPAAQANGRMTRSQTTATTVKAPPKPSKSTAKVQPKKTTTSTARPTTKVDRKPTAPIHDAKRSLKKPPTVAPLNIKNKTTRNGSNAPQKEKKPSVDSFDISKVSCYRGNCESFAPEEFTFTAPSNISTFEFKPLSPASSANFLYPNDTATTSFFQSEPKRCSTPKTAKIELDFLKQMNTNPVQHSPLTKTPTSDVTLPATVSDQEKTENSTEELDENTLVCEKTSLEQSAKDDGSSPTKDNKTASEPEKVVDKQLTTVLNESRRITRSLRRSLDSQEIQNSIEANRKNELETEEKQKNSNLVVEDMDVDSKPTEIKPCEMDTVQTSGVTTEIKPCQMDTVQTSIVTSEDENKATIAKDNPDAISRTPVRLTRSVRRSLCIALPEDSLGTPQKKETQTEQKDETKEQTNSGTSTPRSARKTRRTMSNIAQDEFQIPSNTSLPLSSKRSHKKRRKTQYDTVLEPLKSPEEWIDLLKSSPMIEMNRKKTPSTSKKMPALNLDMDIDAPVFTDTDVLSQNLAKELSFTEDKGTPVREHSAETKENSENKENEVDKPEEHNVKYFRNLLRTETDRLNNLSVKWEKIKSDIPSDILTEEIEGQIRTVTGQAQLLISSKFKQFSGLVDDCEFNRGEKETTCLDLQGFWEMMYSQVVDVDVKFCGLDKLQANNWVEEKPVVTKKVVKKKANPKPVTKPVVKSKFAAFRAQMKKNNGSEFPGPTPLETKVFDAGVFKIVSPVKSPRFHCEAGSPKPKAAPSKEPVHVPSPVCLPPAVETVEPIIMTPKRKSYIPVVPSPLLVDTTPQPICKRRSDMVALPKGKRICSDVKEESDVEIEEEEKDDVFCEQPKTVVTPSTRTKKTPRRSVRSRKSVSFSESFSAEPSQVPEGDNGDWFNKFLQPTDRRVSVAPKESVLDSLDTVNDDTVNSNSCSKRTRSLKELPSSQRRRSSRRISSVPSPVPENLDLHSTETINELENDNVLFTPPSKSNSTSGMSGKFSNLNVQYTPMSRKSRPSLLFTPPESKTDLSTCNTSNVPTDVLISFTP